MKSKYKLTSFARFILFMAVFLPGSYLGISLYKGDIAIEDLHYDFSTSLTAQEDSPIEQANHNCSEIIQLKEQEISLLKERIQILEESN